MESNFDQVAPSSESCARCKSPGRQAAGGPTPCWSPQMDEYEVQVALALQASKREAKEAAARNKLKADRRRTVEEAELMRAQRVSLRATGSDVCRHADALSFKYWESDS